MSVANGIAVEQQGLLFVSKYHFIRAQRDAVNVGSVGAGSAVVQFERGSIVSKCELKTNIRLK